MNPIKIILIGSGNLATQLGTSLHSSGYFISQVYSPQLKNASLLAKKVKAEAINNLKDIDTTATIYIIAVKDDAIATLAKQLKLNDKMVVHTSGSVSMDVLKSVSKNIGVFYPLQTFSKTKKANFKTIPICIEANNKSTLENLTFFAKSISTKVENINSAQRQQLHVAAVFACNFSNHMFTLADNYLKANKLSLDLLKPLIAETADKIKTGKPTDMQTGPAVRGDKKTMDAHLKLLSGNKNAKTIYSLLSNSIIETSKKNK
jgi:predicted short-subunit dehydrogenase-like oxidoreductase (DUF2520 family)